MFAFSAKAFIENTATNFVIAYGQAIIMQGLTVTTAARRLVSNSLFMDKIGDIYILSATEAWTVKRWFYHHPVRRPWGNPTPVQCSSCRALNCWDEEKVKGFASPLTEGHYLPITLFCKGCRAKGNSSTLCFALPLKKPIVLQEFERGWWMEEDMSN